MPRYKPVVIEGTGQAVTLLWGVKNRVPAAVWDAMGKTGKKVRDIARDLAPKDTHALEQAIYWYRVKERVSGLRDARNFGVRIAVNKRRIGGRGGEKRVWVYGMYQELGFTHARSGKFISNPFLKPATTFLMDMVEGSRRGLKKAVEMAKRDALKVRKEDDGIRTFKGWKINPLAQKEASDMGGGGI